MLLARTDTRITPPIQNEKKFREEEEYTDLRDSEIKMILVRPRTEARNFHYVRINSTSKRNSQSLYFSDSLSWIISRTRGKKSLKKIPLHGQDEARVWGEGGFRNHPHHIRGRKQKGESPSGILSALLIELTWQISTFGLVNMNVLHNLDLSSQT